MHVWADLATQLVLLATPFALARALWPGTVAAAALAVGAAGLAVTAVTVAAWSVPGAAGGLIQRAELVSLHLWVLIVGCGILHATRGAPRTSALVPMQPRDFFATSWRGEGALVLRPFVLGRLFRQRVAARREATWISDRVWRVDDESRFAADHAERRHMYCELRDDGRVRLTANDLVDGAEVLLEAGGFRLPEWRMVWKVGPLPLVFRCADRSRLEPDGTFVNVVDVYTPAVRIPLARVTFRVRPVAAEPAPEVRAAAPAGDPAPA